MRIISGLLKGRSINFSKNSNTRPLKDSVKENIFNILKHSSLINVKIENSNILDLYSGFGSFGIECISRGAKKVTFVEQDSYAANLLRENLIRLSVINKSKMYVDKLENVIGKYINEKFHIIFLDPPFADKNFLKNLLKIKKKAIFFKNHIVILHRDEKSKDDISNFLKVIEVKQYGRSKIIFSIFN
tara:strand:+ start:860 stop:1420 length:561 start_codon:yes stop_codon:yes gene_type:complete